MPKNLTLCFLLVLAALLLNTAACRPGDGVGLRYSAGAYPEAEKIFHSNPGWLGADAALTISLGQERTL